jgi:hypothetical protein
MKNKITITLLILTFFILKSFGQETITGALKAEVSILKQGYYPYIGMEQCYYFSFRNAFIYGKLSDVELKITNTSGKKVYFYAMTCSWEDNLRFDNLFVMCWRFGCDSNYPTLIALEPGQSEIFKTTICIRPRYTYTYLRVVEGKKIARTKLGFIITDDFYNEHHLLEENIYEYAKEKTNQVTTIWSNPLNFL